jgi:hypothetical protein
MSRHHDREGVLIVVHSEGAQQFPVAPLSGIRSTVESAKVLNDGVK